MQGSFVTLHNDIGYPLLAPPDQLSQMEIGAIFVGYLTGRHRVAVAGP
ncbi:hypothetical protein WN982_20120 [Paraburkholderia sp. IMGN_8]